MRILVTGSEGFVGKVLVNNLIKRGYEVIGLDRVNSSQDGYIFHQLELNKKILLEKQCYDAVIHCAAAKGDWGISKQEFYDDNVLATRNLISYLESCDVRRLIHFSTVSIYSKSGKGGELEATVSPDSVYGKTKLESEYAIRKYSNDNKIPTIILRPSVIYGRGNFANMFNLIKQLDRKLPFQIKPNGITKSHVSVRNVSEVVMRFINPSSEYTGIKIYNLTERPYYNLESIMTIICDELGVRQPKLNVPLWMVAIPFGALEILGKILNKDTGFTLDRLRKFSSSTDYTSEKLWNETGVQKYSTDSELREMVKWFKKEIR